MLSRDPQQGDTASRLLWKHMHDTLATAPVGMTQQNIVLQRERGRDEGMQEAG